MTHLQTLYECIRKGSPAIQPDAIHVGALREYVTRLPQNHRMQFDGTDDEVLISPVSATPAFTFSAKYFVHTLAAGNILADAAGGSRISIEATGEILITEDGEAPTTVTSTEVLIPGQINTIAIDILADGTGTITINGITDAVDFTAAKTFSFSIIGGLDGAAAGAFLTGILWDILLDQTSFPNTGTEPHHWGTAIAVLGSPVAIILEEIPTVLNRPLTLPVYAVADLPDAALYIGGIIRVSNGNAGAPCLAQSNGTDWLRIVLGAAVAAA